MLFSYTGRNDLSHGERKLSLSFDQSFHATTISSLLDSAVCSVSFRGKDEYGHKRERVTHYVPFFPVFFSGLVVDAALGSIVAMTVPGTVVIATATFDRFNTYRSYKNQRDL